ncbi:biotin-dependent carboxyltransferase family protein [Aureimonas populi]|uniref:Biotin-dependent carboxyltransferase family protein n=2 Tax=Aureimonas populi TaxID=1701758 RepID=A0ABW5CLE2_9HYPH|nr:biotin-dependent carboxyltransferase family protein [Aureimonas populi]
MTTVQDSGRRGYLRFGVSASGPMDAAAFAIANALVGNGPGAACLEFALTGGSFELSRPARLAVTGGSLEIVVDGRRVPAWRAFHARAGARITLGALRDAVWGYLAVSGGIDTVPVMGSRATHLRSGLGGLDGRSLRPGDVLPLGEESGAPLLALARPFRPRSAPIHVVPGPQAHFFDADAWRSLTREPFRVTSKRDRMAMILEGPLLSSARGHDIVSDGTVMGSIQIPPSGHPVILMADRQTTGGYAKIATVITCDIGRLAQTVSRDPIAFRPIAPEAAIAYEREARMRLREAISDLSPAPEPRT